MSFLRPEVGQAWRPRAVFAGYCIGGLCCCSFFQLLVSRYQGGLRLRLRVGHAWWYGVRGIGMFNEEDVNWTSGLYVNWNDSFVGLLRTWDFLGWEVFMATWNKHTILLMGRSFFKDLLLGRVREQNKHGMIRQATSSLSDIQGSSRFSSNNCEWGKSSSWEKS